MRYFTPLSATAFSKSLGRDRAGCLSTTPYSGLRPRRRAKVSTAHHPHRPGRFAMRHSAGMTTCELATVGKFNSKMGTTRRIAFLTRLSSNLPKDRSTARKKSVYAYNEQSLRELVT